MSSTHPSFLRLIKTNLIQPLIYGGCTEKPSSPKVFDLFKWNTGSICGSFHYVRTWHNLKFLWMWNRHNGSDCSIDVYAISWCRRCIKGYSIKLQFWILFGRKITIFKSDIYIWKDTDVQTTFSISAWTATVNHHNNETGFVHIFVVHWAIVVFDSRPSISSAAPLTPPTPSQQNNSNMFAYQGTTFPN